MFKVIDLFVGIAIHHRHFFDARRSTVHHVGPGASESPLQLAIAIHLHATFNEQLTRSTETASSFRTFAPKIKYVKIRVFYTKIKFIKKILKTFQ